MKSLINSLFFGRDAKLSGAIALSVVLLVLLGCTCGKNFDLSDTGSNSSSTNSSSSDDTPSKTKPTFTKADASKGELPSNAELQDMVKTTLLDFDAAVQKEDFSDFYAHICKPWQSQTSPEKLKTSFQPFIDKHISITPIKSLDAEFSPDPEVGREVGFKTLMLQGKYDTSPNMTKFEINYIPEGKEWKLSKIVVDTTETK
jgi:hypothetical protein